MHRYPRLFAHALRVVSPLVLVVACSRPATSNEAGEQRAGVAPSSPPTAEPSASAASPTAPSTAAAPAPSAPVEKRTRRDEVVAPAPTSVAAGPRASSAAPAASAPAPIVTDASSALARQLDAVFAGAKTFRARFEQSYAIAAQGVEKRSSGTVMVARPGKVAFLYDAPNGNRIVSDGKELHVYDAGSQQDFVQPFAKAQLPGAFGFLMGQGVADAFHFRANASARPGEALLLGTPIEPTPAYEHVQFTIDTAKLAKQDVGALTGVLIIDAQRNKNRFTFTGGVIPERIGDAEFAFTPPAGTSIKRL